MALSQGSGVRLEPQLAQPRLVVTLAEVGPAHHFGLPFHDQRKAFYTSRLARRLVFLTVHKGRVVGLQVGLRSLAVRAPLRAIDGEGWGGHFVRVWSEKK